MKKCIIAAAFGALACCLNTNQAAAQNEPSDGIAANENFVSEHSGNTALYTVSNPKNGARKLHANEVSAKAVRSLKHWYKEAGEASWSLVNRSYLAAFEVNGKRSKALFTKNGYMIYGISYGSEQDLPREERRILKSNYVDFNITSVAEVHTADGVYWICTLQDKDHIVVTRSHNGSLEELQHLSKQFQPRSKKGRVDIQGKAA